MDNTLIYTLSKIIFKTQTKSLESNPTNKRANQRRHIFENFLKLLTINFKKPPDISCRLSMLKIEYLLLSVWLFHVAD